MSIIIFTDLDGTLLGHRDYAFEPALPLINDLQSQDIDVVLSTSKTLPEVLEWRRQLGVSGPFMVENGSAIYLPHGYLKNGAPAGFEETGHGLRKILGAGIAELRACLAPFEGSVVDFTTCPLEQAMALTGLDESSALAARDRQFSIPLHLEDPQLEQALMHAAGAQGLRCTRGGRFLHLQGACNKGLALHEIRRTIVDEQSGDVAAIALGDNENDRAMLEAADIPVVMLTDHGHVLKLDHPDAIYTRRTAPEGWVEGVGTALAIVTDTRGGA